MVTGSVFMGCQKDMGTERRQKKVTKIVWQSEQDFQRTEKYFNQVLREKDFPYEVDFVTEDTVKDNQVVDLLDTGMMFWEKSYDLNQDILEGKFIPLDDYLNTEEGKVVKQAFPEAVWDAYKTDGKQYTFLSMGFVPAKKAYIWDKKIAEKYDVHPEAWGEDLWKHEEELVKVLEGEKKSSEVPFLAIEGVRNYLDEPVGMTKVLGLYYPIVIREDDETVTAEFLYETEEYQENLKGFQNLYEKGIYNPDMEESGQLQRRTFLTVDTMFMSKDAYGSWRTKEFWDMHDVKEFGREALWHLSCNADETGITVESKHPEEVFRFMCELYKDEELINALTCGEEDVDFILEENRAVGINPQERYFACNSAGNRFMGYVRVGEDKNKRELYPKLLKEAKVSKINGFKFSGKRCTEELGKVFQVTLERNNWTGKEILYKNEKIVQMYKDAGIDKVIDEWNRQFKEWKQN